MQAIFSVTLPFFALVLCGYLAARSNLLPQSAISGLNAFVLYFALPCLLFRFGESTPILQLLNPSVLLVYTLCAVAMVGITVGLTRSARLGMKDAAFGALVAAFPNTGYMGVPLLVALMGPAAAGPVICTVLVDLCITSSLCIALAQAEGAKGSGQRAAALRALRGVLSNPMPWSIALGAAFSVADWKLAGPPGVVVRMLADAASPVALFTIGAVLWRAGLHTHTRTPPDQYVPVAMIKLFVHPLLVFELARLARHLGAPLSTFDITVLSLAAALPSASNVSLLAERFKADNGRIARIIMTSTVAAFGSFSLLAWWFGVQPRF